MPPTNTFAHPVYGENPPTLCDCCGVRLNPVLIKMDLARHPCCDPDEQPGDWRTGKQTPLDLVRPMPYRSERVKGFKRPSEVAAERPKPPRVKLPEEPDDKPVRPVTDIPLPGF